MLTRADIQLIKRQRPLAAEVERYGIGLRQSGRTFVGCCPFHADHAHPNFTIYPAADPADDSFFCFACGGAGDVIAFVRRTASLSFGQAIERLVGGAPPRTLSLRRRPRPVAKPRPLGLAERACLMAAVELYSNQLTGSPAAQTYLASRGIDPATAERCHVGYATGDQLLPYLRWRRLPIGGARRAGLLDRQGQETMAERIVVPEFRAGRAVWLIGRLMQADPAAPKYLGLSGRKPLLGWESASGGSAVVLTEGIFDWLSLRQWRLPAVAVCGTHVQARALEALRRFERVYLAFDDDAAGREATQRLVATLGDRAIPVAMPLGLKDVNEVAQHPDASRLLLASLESVQQGRAVHDSQPAPREHLGVAA